MSHTLLRTAVFPSRYVQGAGALAVLLDEIARLGTKPLIIVDRTVEHLGRSTSGTACDVHVVDSVCTWESIASARKCIRDGGYTVVAGMGGGKVIDTVRAACDGEGIPFVSVPTIAASDAPTSSLAVVYNPNGSVDRDFFVKRNPALVLIDTQVIVDAPVRFFVAGIGDALSTWFEADSCKSSGKGNIIGRQGATLAYTAARTCYDIIRQYGPAAVSHCVEGLVTAQVEEVVEASVLLSGLGFESGGVAAPHAIHHGLTQLSGTHDYLHGEKVAIGVQASLFLRPRPLGEIEEVFSFSASVGLPLCLDDIGVDSANDSDLYDCAERACQPGEIIHNEPFKVTPPMVVSALRSANEFGRRYSRRPLSCRKQKESEYAD